MLAKTQHSRGWRVLLGLWVCAGASAAPIGYAQQTTAGGYSVAEAGDAQTSAAVPPAGAVENTGPVRLARFAFLQGNVTWRTDEDSDWSPATLNLPLRQGAQISVADGARAEIQFDDGSLLRLGTGAVISLQTLYSDNEGEFTELKMTYGLASLRLRTDRGIYQVNTPLGSVKAAGPAGLRLGIGDGLEVAVQSGKATIEGAPGKGDLQAGDFLDLADADSPYTLRDVPGPDSWDRWNQERDSTLNQEVTQPANEHLPSDIAIVAPDLSSYGSWRSDSVYGWVWVPTVTSPDWRPYHDGSWTWVNPFGWTWVSNEPWGWAPYHYGTWVAAPYGWAWCPGPVNQYWSPAVVQFAECDGAVAWCPLAPSEVRYPTVFGFGFTGGNWSTYFSIGGAAVYYPVSGGYCTSRVFDTRYVNRVSYVANVTRFGFAPAGYAVNSNVYATGGSIFIPINSRAAAGVSAVAGTGFGSNARYVAVAKGDTSLFARGRAIAAPPQGLPPLAGPIAARPTPQAMTPTRSFTPALPAAVTLQSRPVYRAAPMPTIARNSAPITSTGRVVIASQAEYNRPPVAQNAYRSANRNSSAPGYDRPGQAYNRAATNGTRSNGTNSQEPGRSSAPTRGTNGQYPGQGQNPGQGGRYGTGASNGVGSLDKGTTRSSSAKSTTAAADAAAAARASLSGANRARPDVGSAPGVPGPIRAPQYNGPTGVPYGGAPSTGSPSNGAGSNGSSANGSSSERSGTNPPARQPQSPPRSNPPTPGPSAGSGSKGTDPASGNKGQNGKGS